MDRKHLDFLRQVVTSEKKRDLLIERQNESSGLNVSRIQSPSILRSDSNMTERFPLSLYFPM